MELFDYAWIPEFYERIKELKGMAMEEEWDYKKHPSGKEPILVNYIKHTFMKLCEEEKVYAQGDYSVFNTGLVTRLQEEIFALFQRNKRKGRQEWFFLGWKRQSDVDLVKFEKLPDCANYFDNVSDLIYDTKLELRANVNHIIEDNIGRFPKVLQEKGKLQLLLPLCLTSKAVADLALVVEKVNNIYRASTCLTLDMAINNARLIAKPDDEWLKV